MPAAAPLLVTPSLPDKVIGGDGARRLKLNLPSSPSFRRRPYACRLDLAVSDRIRKSGLLSIATHCVNQSVAKLNLPGSPFMSASPSCVPTSYWCRSWLYTYSSSLMRSWHEASACGDLHQTAMVVDVLNKLAERHAVAVETCTAAQRILGALWRRSH